MQRVFYAGDFIATQLIGWFTVELSNQLTVMLASFEPFDVSMVMSRVKFILGRRGHTWTCLLPRWNALSLTNVDCVDQKRGSGQTKVRKRKLRTKCTQKGDAGALKNRLWGEINECFAVYRSWGEVRPLLLWQIFEFSFCLFFLTGR